MKQYYFNNNDQPVGPFSLEELKEKNISAKTMVWFEGSEIWIEAERVDELKDIFKKVPPPITKTQSIAPPPISTQSEYVSEEVFPSNNSNRNKIILGVLGVVILLAIFFIYRYNQANAERIEREQLNTVQQQYLQQQLDEQKTKLAEQERIEAERVAAEERAQAAVRKNQREEELTSLQIQLDDAITNVRAAEAELERIKVWKPLRTAAVRDNQVRSQLEMLRSWENEVVRLRNEIKKY